MAKASDRRAQAFLQHLEPLKAALETYCRRSVYDVNAVEDVLQEAVGKAYRDFHLYAEGTNFRAWMFRYVTLEIYAGNRAYHRHRHATIADELAIEDVSSNAVDEPHLELLLERPDWVLNHCDDTLAAAIYDLPLLERSALLLRVIGQFKHREMADILAVPMGTVMSALSRARSRLRVRLAGYAREHGLLDAQPARNPR